MNYKQTFNRAWRRNWGLQHFCPVSPVCCFSTISTPRPLFHRFWDPIPIEIQEFNKVNDNFVEFRLQISTDANFFYWDVV